jgi:hypothetical protein
MATQSERESFKFKNNFASMYDTQCEIIHRLIAERLQRGLEKQGGENPADPDSWRLNAEEVYYLARAFEILHTIRLNK